MVMGASVGAKLVMVCGAPSSVTRKFSFFRPVRMSPFLVVAMTSSVTTGTSTAMVTPASGGAWVGGLAGGFCCGPAAGRSAAVGRLAARPGACAKAGGSASTASEQGSSTAAVTMCGKIAFHAVILFFAWQHSSRIQRGAVESTQRRRTERPKPRHLHVSMKRNRRKVLQGEILRDRRRRRFVSGKPRLLMAMSLAAALAFHRRCRWPRKRLRRPRLKSRPPPRPQPPRLSSPSPIGDTTALAKEAQGWLIDLIRTNTTNPPGNEEWRRNTSGIFWKRKAFPRNY